MATPEIRKAHDLVVDIEHRITAGHLSPGQRLAPVRTVAAELGLAPNTVSAAYRTLGERGLLVGEGRRGTFVAHRPSINMPVDEQLPEGLIDLASGNPDPRLLPPLGPALAAVSTEHVLYGEPGIDADLDELLRADLASDGIEPDNLAVVAGALDGLERALTAQLRSGDRVAIEDPGYASVAQLVAAMGLRAEPVAVDSRGPIPGSAAKALDAGVAAMIVTPRAQNPTGAALDEERAGILRSLLDNHSDVLLLEDDHAGPIAGQPFLHLGSPRRRRWATVRSVAKSLGPDLRLASLVGDETTVSRVAGRQAVGTGWVSHLLQRVVAQLLSSDEVRAQLDRAGQAYTERRQAVVEVLGANGLDVHGRSGLNVWLGVSDEAHVVAGMERRGLAIRSGARYRQASDPGVRISIARADPETLASAASALVEVVAARPVSRAV